jgi:hypothetical protein
MLIVAIYFVMALGSLFIYARSAMSLPFLIMVCAMWFSFAAKSIIKRRLGLVAFYLRDDAEWLIWFRIIIFCIGAILFLHYFFNGQHDISALLLSAYFLSLTLQLNLYNREMPFVTQNGFYDFGNPVRWRQIKTFEWKEFDGHYDVLTVRLKPHWLLWGNPTVHVLKSDRELMEKLLEQER